MNKFDTVLALMVGRGCPVDRDGSILQQDGFVRFSGNQYNPVWSWDLDVLRERNFVSLCDIYHTAYKERAPGDGEGFPKLSPQPDPIFELDHGLATMPYRSKERSVGLDIHPCESVYIGAGDTKLIPTGLRCSYNYGWGAFFWDRSGMGFKGFHRFAGVIESDYVGFWGVVLHNGTDKGEVFTVDKAIVQVVFQEVWIGEPRQGIVNRDTDRGEAGFGSTDK